MEDFEIMYNDQATLVQHARKIAKSKHFDLNIKQKSGTMVNLSCKMSPYYSSSNAVDVVGCPFRVRYKLHKEQLEFYLFDFDEMHNHLLNDKPAIMPMPQRHKTMLKFSTPRLEEVFGSFEAPDALSLKAKLSAVALTQNIPLKQREFGNDMVCVGCAFQVYGNNEADVSEMLASNEIGRIRAAMQHI